jgi:NAD(P)H-hydrate repair Nnr-like enzyme with NAD(P)H-hydrate dehydratase domain
MHADLRDALAARGDRITILTPHAGEAARLAAGYGIALDLDGNRVAAVQQLARATGCIVLLKGPSTLISDGSTYLATPLLGSQLATAGSGDVLAGLLAGALARWSAAGSPSVAMAMELAAACAIRHAAAAAPADTTASDLVEGLQQMW